MVQTTPRIGDVIGFNDMERDRSKLGGSMQTYFTLSVPDDQGDFTAELDSNDPEFPGQIRAFNMDNMPEKWANFGDTRNIRGEWKPPSVLNARLLAPLKPYVIGGIAIFLFWWNY